MLIPEWRRVLKRAWSVRLLAAATVLQIADVLLPYAADLVPFWLPPVVTLAALGARFVSQPAIHTED